MLEIRRRFLRRREVRRHDSVFRNKSPGNIFSEIYARAMWGSAEDSDGFSSGHGSHIATHVEPYVVAVSQFLRAFATPPNVVDLGCGDFNVGRQIREHCAGYVACDVVPGLIERNRKKFCDLGVEFRCVDIISDPLPPGDVVILRQVLQHLSNEHIMRVVNNLGGYGYVVLTEYLPEGTFVPNVDQPTGRFSRLARGIESGVVLTREPFFLKARSEKLICCSREPPGLVTTLVYELSGNTPDSPQ